MATLQLSNEVAAICNELARLQPSKVHVYSVLTTIYGAASWFGCKYTNIYGAPHHHTS